MAETTGPSQGSSSQSAASAVGAGIGPAISGIFNNLWSAKERRRSEEYNSKQLQNEQNFARSQADIQWQRSIDYKQQMQAYKDAGINPYMVASKGVQPTMGASPSGNLPQQAKFNFDSIGAFAQNTAQLALINAQTKNIEAQTQKTQAEAGQTQFNLLSDQTYKNLERETGLQNAQQVNNNLNQTSQNLAETQRLLQQDQKTKEIQNRMLEVDSLYQRQLKNLEAEGKTIQNSQSRLQISKTSQEIENLKQTTEQIKSYIELNMQALQTGKISQIKMLEEINKIIAEKTTIDDMRQPLIRSTERQNRGILTPLKSIEQEGNRFGRWDKYYNTKTKKWE